MLRGAADMSMGNPLLMISIKACTYFFNSSVDLSVEGLKRSID